MRKSTLLIMTSTIAAIITTYVLAMALPNQVFAQSNTGGGLGHVPGELAAGGHVVTDTPISSIDTPASDILIHDGSGSDIFNGGTSDHNTISPSDHHHVLDYSDLFTTHHLKP